MCPYIVIDGIRLCVTIVLESLWCSLAFKIVEFLRD